MKNKYAILLLFIVLLSILLFCGCASNHIDEDDATEEMANQIIEYLNNEDTAGLKAMFSKNASASNDLDKEIAELYNFLDGKIVSYENFSSGSGSETIEQGKQILLTASPKIKGVETDSGKTYMIRFYVYLVYDKDVNEVGIAGLKIIADDERECLAGDW